jgi:uncharacterized protein YjbI with pentapeptide repeats
MAGSRRLAAVVVGLALAWNAAPADAETGEQLAKALGGTRPVFREGAEIKGFVDLRGVGDVKVPFVCRACTFTQGLRAPHVRFERTVDLSNSTIGEADLEGARFNEALLLGGATIARRGDFKFAAFLDLTDFAGASFGRDADFSSTRFEALARFSAATFSATTTFAASRFGREALFSRATFLKEAIFDGAVFGRVTDFRGANFMGPAFFLTADFGGRADFSRATMGADARFDDARFAADALFIGTAFDPRPAPSASFESASVLGRPDFTAAVLSGITTLLRLSAGSLLFTDTTFTRTSVLYMDEVSVAAFELSLDDIGRIATQGNQERALDSIEATAKATGDISLANDARYRLQEVASNDDWQPRRLADFVFYRWMAGYLVRPLRPLLWLLGLVLLCSLIRTILVEYRGERWQKSRFAQTSGRFVKQLAYTVTPKSASPETPAHRRVELTVYVVLLACFLIGLANSNPTLREIVDAVI